MIGLIILALASATQPQELSLSQQLLLGGAVSNAFPPCKTSLPDQDDVLKYQNIGVFRVILPTPFIIGPLLRKVTFERQTITTSQYTDKNTDGTWKGDDNFPYEPNPFNVLLRDIEGSIDGDKEYFLVRIIIQEGSSFTFHDATDEADDPIHGVSLVKKQSEVSAPKIPINKRLICGRIPVETRLQNPNNIGVKEVASFLVELRRRGKKGSIYGYRDIAFNILLQPLSASGQKIDLPIIIDPKVHDNGVN